MELFDVQITTDLGETIVLQVSASSPQSAEMTAISMVECGDAGTISQNVVDCFALKSCRFHEIIWRIHIFIVILRYDGSIVIYHSRM